MSKFNLLTAVILAGLLSACSQTVDETLAELERLCRKDAGVTVYKTVVADGYYDSVVDCNGCWGLLIESDYEYMEACTNNPKAYDPINEHGCWRFSKIDKLLGRCHKGIEAQINDYSLNRYVQFRRDQCIESVKLEEIKARYEVASESSIVYVSFDKKHNIQRYSEKVIDRSLNNNLADSVYYVANVYSPMAGGYVGVGCGKFGIEGADKFYRKVIIANK